MCYVGGLRDESSRSSGARVESSRRTQIMCDGSLCPKCGVMAGFMRCTICEIMSCRQYSQHCVASTECLSLSEVLVIATMPRARPRAPRLHSVTVDDRLCLVNLAVPEAAALSPHNASPWLLWFPVLVTVQVWSSSCITDRGSGSSVVCQLPHNHANTRPASRQMPPPRCRPRPGLNCHVALAVLPYLDSRPFVEGCDGPCASYSLDAFGVLCEHSLGTSHG